MAPTRNKPLPSAVLRAAGAGTAGRSSAGEPGRPVAASSLTSFGCPAGSGVPCLHGCLCQRLPLRSWGREEGGFFVSFPPTPCLQPGLPVPLPSSLASPKTGSGAVLGGRWDGMDPEVDLAWPHSPQVSLLDILLFLALAPPGYLNFNSSPLLFTRGSTVVSSSTHTSSTTLAEMGEEKGLALQRCKTGRLTQTVHKRLSAGIHLRPQPCTPHSCWCWLWHRHG